MTHQSTVESLMYAIGTCPQLIHTVGVSSQFSANLDKAHWDALKHVFWYLCEK